MHIVHVSQWRLPVRLYGGSQRVVFWQAKAQARLGHRVTLVTPLGSTCPGAEVIGVPRGSDFTPYVPADADVVQFIGSRWADGARRS
jgi:hypothetical protein